MIMGMSPDIRAQKMSKVLQSFVATKSVQLLDGIKAPQDVNFKTSHHSPLKPRKKMKRANSEQVVQLQSHADKKEPLDTSAMRNHHEKLPAIHKAEILT